MIAQYEKPEVDEHKLRKGREVVNRAKQDLID
jgi:hypothetical protein